MEKKETMSYETFIQKVLKRMGEEFSKEHTVTVNPVTKNNSIHLDGLVIMKEGDNAAPTIYLNSFYETYEKGKDFEEIVEEIKSLYHKSHAIEQYSTSICFENFEELKSKIIFRVVNFDRNEKMLQAVPYKKILDLAVTYHYLVESNKEGIRTVRITNELMERWNTNLNEIAELAKENTPRLFPAIIQSMDEFVNNLEIETEREIINHEEWNDVEEGSKLSAMYILTNNQCINGASCLLYDVIERFASKMKTDLYILPSSIHELILVPKQKNIKKSELKRMVKEVNDAEVPYEDILSYQVYSYDREEVIVRM